ncbi:MAG: PadR family transcriptional regulator [Chroococcidiopsidaceae cyanobacterium CP_BM_ER_R8_30]|nr:PadR family transcriptional regulator [Chroococcidiopsidaceae cyanobacterium CP_BM_ER_R8_30]
MTTLGYALLGLLAREPFSGYELAQKMKAPIGCFWHAKHSQIYPELAKLKAQGLVNHELVEQQEHPDKKVYTITPAGRDALRQWVTAPMEVPHVRDELVLRAYSLWLADPQAAILLFRTHEQRHVEQLRRYEALQQKLMEEAGAKQQVDSPDFSSYVTLALGIGYERLYSEWCRWVAEQFEQADTTL